MNSRVRRLVLATTTAAIVVIAAVVLQYQLNQRIHGVPGVVFWTLATFVAGALPVVLPRGTVVSVSVAPMLTSIFLGGPLAAVVVAAIGTTDIRELRGRVPWYGTLYNHASLVIAAVAAAVVHDAVIGNASSELSSAPISLLAAVLAGITVFALNSALSVIAVSTRTGTSIRTIWGNDFYGIALTMAGLVPLAWLMSLVFTLPNGVGWWATPLFVVPLFTARVAFARYVETRELFEQTIEALAKAIDARDEYTRHHSSRVSHIAEAMCRVMGLAENEIERIKWAGYLHDVGKIGIRDHILLKEGPLDKRERIMMNQHPAIGARIVEPASQLRNEAPLILAHHEWFNGSGYPNGTEATDIPRGARILSVADAYEAMTSARPYRKTPLTHEQAVEQLTKFSGIQFDPEIVPVLVNLDRSILDWRPDTEERGPTTLERDEDEFIPAPDTAPPAQSRPALASDDVS